MRMNGKPWNESSRESKSRINGWRIQDMRKHLENYDADPRQKERITQQRCKFCYYAGSQLGLAVITVAPCGCCGQDQTYGSSAIDTLCESCAVNHDCCKECGGAMD